MLRIYLFCVFFSAICCLCIGALGCKKENTTAMNDTSAIHSKTYLALGDSYTIGEGVQDNERYPYLTTALLRNQGIDIAAPKYIAVTGWTTIDLMNAINRQEPLGTFDIVTLLIGVNDQYQGMDTAGYRIRFTQLLQKAIALADNNPHHVFVLSIPDYSATPFVPAANKATVSKAIADFNAINQQISANYNIAYINITPLTKAAANDASLLAGDNLHYSAKEYQQWAELLTTQISKAIQ